MTTRKPLQNLPHQELNRAPPGAASNAHLVKLKQSQKILEKKIQNQNPALESARMTHQHRTTSSSGTKGNAALAAATAATAAVDVARAHPATTPRAKRDNHKEKEKPSALCKTPPSTIKNPRGNKNFKRGLCLGAGGFARCFQVNDSSGKVYAAKTVAKASLLTEKNKSKIVAEIKIHKTLMHPNIVRFIDCFEDDTNVYILLEMCSNSSLMDLIRKRKTLTEPEARFFLTQIIGAVKFMHNMGVIHRDLKLGNIFLDDNMNTKIGDFGLAALLYSKSDRKKTICGTPNYIAPEVLYGRDKGHSYEVDVWSIGIILYVMLVGKPPFQSRKVETIYERIKNNDYEIPNGADVSLAARDLISGLLSTDPNARPTLNQVLEHPFFRGPFPAGLDSSIITTVPEHFYNIGPEESEQNFLNCMIDAQIIDESRRLMSKKKDVNVEAMIQQAVRDPRARHSILPNSLSPVATKEKYKEVVVQRPERGEEVQDDRVRDMNKIETDQYSMMPTGTKSNRNDDPKREEVQTYETAEDNVSPIFTIESSKGITTVAVPPPRLPDPHAIFHCGAGLITDLLQSNFQEYHMDDDTVPQVVYITKWVDYTNRFGIGYELSNGTSGVLRPDGTIVQLNYVANTFDKIYYDTTHNVSVFRRITSTEDENITEDDNRNFHLVGSMHKYMDENLRICCDAEVTCIDDGYEQKVCEAKYLQEFFQGKVPGVQAQQAVFCGHPDNVVYLLGFERIGDSYLFQLSDGSCQVNFSDHTKFVFNASGDGVTVINHDSMHYLGLRDGYVCCQQMYDRVVQNDFTLSFIRDKMLSCKKILQHMYGSE